MNPFETLSIDRSGNEVITVHNKCDLTDQTFGYDDESRVARVSALTGDGIGDLTTGIRNLVGFQAGEGVFTARQRHLDALRRARTGLDAAREVATASGAEMPELVAEELGSAHAALGEIVGTVSADDLLGEIFSNFCIGK